MSIGRGMISGVCDFQQADRQHTDCRRVDSQTDRQARCSGDLPSHYCTVRQHTEGGGERDTRRVNTIIFPLCVPDYNLLAFPSLSGLVAGPLVLAAQMRMQLD